MTRSLRQIFFLLLVSSLLVSCKSQSSASIEEEIPSPVSSESAPSSASIKSTPKIKVTILAASRVEEVEPVMAPAPTSFSGSVE